MHVSFYRIKASKGQSTWRFSGQRYTSASLMLSCRVFTRSSKRPAISTCILNTFAGRLLDRGVNAPLKQPLCRIVVLFLHMSNLLIFVYCKQLSISNWTIHN